MSTYQKSIEADCVKTEVLRLQRWEVDPIDSKLSQFVGDLSDGNTCQINRHCKFYTVTCRPVVGNNCKTEQELCSLCGLSNSHVKQQ